jgi:threonine/homoserine/homoserine lactone efflux protein
LPIGIGIRTPERVNIGYRQDVLAALLTFTTASVLIVLLPGPDTLVVVRNLLRGGRRQAAWAAAGVLAGLAVWVTTAALGLSALLRASHAGYDALRLAGAAYLFFLGVQSLRSRAVPMSAEPAMQEPATQEPEHRRRPGLLGSGFGAGFATDLLNPKVGVFFVTFLPGFVPHGANVAAASAAFGAIFIAETAVYFAVLVGLAAKVTRWMNDPRIRKRLERATGVVLLGFGIRLATET